jgi:hypothetical protein
MMDITEYVNNIKNGEKVIIVMNKCDSEEGLIHDLQVTKAKSKAANLLNRVANQIEDQDDEDKQHETKPPKAKSNKGNDKGIKCPDCNSPDSAIIIDGSVHPCKTCQKINEGLQNGTIPPIPPKDHLNKAKKKIEDNNESQKKSIFRFYQRNKNKNDSTDDMETSKK